MQYEERAARRRFVRWLLLGMALSMMTQAPAFAQETAEDELERLEERVSELEEQRGRAEGDQLPWHDYVDELGGRIMFDQTFVADSDPLLRDTVGGGELEEGAEFRRARLFAEGSLAPWLDYKLQVGFPGGVSAKSIYIEAHDLWALPEIRIGHFKEPLSIQEQTSSKYISLMSRSMLADEVGSVGRSAGVMLTDHFFSERLNVAAGLFDPRFDADTFQTQGDGDSWALSARATSPLVYRGGGDVVAHVGGYFSHRSVDSFTLGQEPEVHKTDDFMGGTVSGLDNRRIYGGELAGVWRPVHAQAEYVRSTLNTDVGADGDIDTWYVQGGVFLTGERRPYDRASGSFGRVQPDAPFTGPGTGPGAWELVARHSAIDPEGMADAPVFTPGISGPGIGVLADAVRETDVQSVGVNWYPVSHAKWMLNVVRADRETLGEATYVTTRFQVDF